MKRILFLIILSLTCTALQAQEGPIIPQRETVVVDNFTAAPNIPLGLYQYARQSVIEGLSRHRVNVIDVEEDGYGRPDIVYPSFKFASGNTGNPFDLKRVLLIMDDYSDIRWYLTVYLTHFNSHPVEHKSKDKEGKEVIRTDFTAEMEADLFLYDTQTQATEGPYHWKCTYSGASDPAYAEQHAVSNLAQKANTFVTDRFRFKCSVIQLGEYNRRGKLQDLYLSCGSDMNVSRGDVFYIYSLSTIEGIETARKIGKVKAREITGRESCRCTVSNGETEINQAFLDGERLVAVSDYDQFF